MTAKHEDRLISIRPRWKLQDGLERAAPDDKRVDRGNELVVAVRFATAGRQEIEASIGSRDEPGEACANEDGSFHCGGLLLLPNDIKLSGERSESAAARC